MDIISFFLGTISSLVAAAIWWYGAKKRHGYKVQKTKELEFEKGKMQAFATNPAELYQDSLAGLFYLILIISLANFSRLFHDFLYNGIVWHQLFIEGSLWFLVGSLAIRYKKRIDGIRDIKATMADIDEKISRLKSSD